ncbi:MAG: BON domain-containing protein [Caulobacteraceae bacterium]
MTRAIAFRYDPWADQEMGLRTLRAEIEAKLWFGLPRDDPPQAKRDPAEVRVAVEAELDSEPGLDSGGIQVSVQQGAVMVPGRVVTLTGEVEWQYQKTVAEQAVRRLSRVLDIVNNIEVRSRRVANDTRIRLQVVPSGNDETSQ